MTKWESDKIPNERKRKEKVCNHVLPEDMKYKAIDGTEYRICRKCKAVFIKAIEQPFAIDKSAEDMVKQLAETVEQ